MRGKQAKKIRNEVRRTAGQTIMMLNRNKDGEKAGIYCVGYRGIYQKAKKLWKQRNQHNVPVRLTAEN